MMNPPLNLRIKELKTFIPSRDFDLSLEFYNAIGFSTEWNNNQTALLALDGFKFILQRFYVKDWAENFVMHLLVDSADDWWKKLREVYHAFNATGKSGLGPAGFYIFRPFGGAMESWKCNLSHSSRPRTG